MAWWKHIAAIGGTGAIFGGERYAEMTWPNVAAETWLMISVLSGIIMFSALYHAQLAAIVRKILPTVQHQQTAASEDWEIVLENPGDVMAVARLIMQAPTLADVERLWTDFEGRSYKGPEEGQVHVAAARRIRHARNEGVKGILWETSRASEIAAELYGRDTYRMAVDKLLREFPE